jgi:hypothetical protein
MTSAWPAVTVATAGWVAAVLALLTFALAVSLAGGLVGMGALWLIAEAHRRDAEGHFAAAERERGEAEAARQQEAQQRRRAEASPYFSRLAQARLEWRLNNAADARHLLARCAPGAGEDDPRGWEWHYLASLTEADLLTIRDPHPVTTGLAFSPDGKWLLSGGGDFYRHGGPTDAPGEVKLWDVGQWRGDAPTFEGRGDVPLGVAFSPDGRHVAAAEVNRAVRVWDTRGGEPRLLAGHKDWVERVAFSPDGRRLLSSDRAGEVRLWDVDSGAPRCTLRGRGAAGRRPGPARQGREAARRAAPTRLPRRGRAPGLGLARLAGVRHPAPRGRVGCAGARGPFAPVSDSSFMSVRRIAFLTAVV